MQYWVIGAEAGVGVCLTSPSSALTSAPTSARSYQAVGPCLSRPQCHIFSNDSMQASGLRCLLPVVQTQSRLHSFVPIPKFDDAQVLPLRLLRPPFGNGGAE